jgi:hypothetical protein
VCECESESEGTRQREGRRMIDDMIDIIMYLGESENCLLFC